MSKKSVMILTIGLFLTVASAAYAAISCPVPPGYDAIVEPICYTTSECIMHQVCELETVCTQDEMGECPEGKTMICHVPSGDPNNAHAICVGDPSVIEYHLEHGDYLGGCMSCEEKEVCHYEKCCKNVVKCICPSFPDDWNVGTQPDAGMPDLSMATIPDAGVLRTVSPDSGRTLPKVMTGNVCNCPEGYTHVPMDETEFVGGCSVDSGSPSVNIGAIFGLLLLVFGIFRKNKIAIIFACLLLFGSLAACVMW